MVPNPKNSNPRLGRSLALAASGKKPKETTKQFLGKPSFDVMNCKENPSFLRVHLRLQGDVSQWASWALYLVPLIGGRWCTTCILPIIQGTRKLHWTSSCFRLYFIQMGTVSICRRLGDVEQELFRLRQGGGSWQLRNFIQFGRSVGRYWVHLGTYRNMIYNVIYIYINHCYEIVYGSIYTCRSRFTANID